MSADIAIRSTARQLAAEFARAAEEVRAEFARILATEERLNRAFGYADEDHRRFRVSACGTYWRDNFADADGAVAILNRQAWSAIVERLELRRFCSIKRWEELEKQIDSGDLPVITEESVMAFYHRHLGMAHEMIHEAVTEVFEWLRPHEWSAGSQLKTNPKLEIGERVILTWIVEYDGSHYLTSHWSIDHRQSQKLLALENVFNGLDGRGTIAKAQRSALETAIRAAKDGTGETDLFEFRAFKNRNLHLRFKRLDLLARFNAIAGGQRLRPAETEEERLRREVAQARAENERLRRQTGVSP